MKLSERLDLAAKILEDIGGQSAMAATVREAAALARRVEDAAVVEVISLMDYNDNTGTMDFDGHIDADPGQRVRLVPDAGQGGGE